MKDSSEPRYRVVLLVDDLYVVERQYLERCGFLWLKRRAVWKAVNDYGSVFLPIPPKFYAHEHLARLAVKRFLRGQIVLPDRDENGKPMPPPNKCLREGDEFPLSRESQ